MNREVHVRICEGRGLRCPRLLGSDEEKAPTEASGRDREGERERIVADVPKPLDDIETGVFRRLRDEPGGYPLTGQVVSGM